MARTQERVAQVDPQEEQVREEARAFFQEKWNPDLTLGEWWRILGDSGWAVPTWPKDWFGKGLSSRLARVAVEERRKAGAMGPPSGIGVMMAGPTIVEHGTEEQKQRLIPPMVYGEEVWCQLFSEPGAGSDLASLQTKAIRDGDEWVVNGQK
ncbi:MAG: acyl-CoA dehydrogenase family protein, partial [Acidimicrobiia bacterium]